MATMKKPFGKCSIGSGFCRSKIDTPFRFLAASVNASP